MKQNRNMKRINLLMVLLAMCFSLQAQYRITGKVTDENKEEVINRYKKQLDLYADVMKNLTGKEVKEKYIYLFGIDEGISI